MEKAAEYDNNKDVSDMRAVKEDEDGSKHAMAHFTTPAETSERISGHPIDASSGQTRIETLESNISSSERQH